MLAVEFILDTFSHLVKHDEGPPPGIPAHADAGFEQDLLRLSECQRLSPLLVYSLKRLVLEPDLSGLSLERLKRDAKRSIRDNERILSKMHCATALFRKKGIPCMIMDGAAVSRTVYPDSILRSIDRIELLVNEMNWAGVMECLNAAGFEQAGGRGDINAPQDALLYHQLAVPAVFRDGEGDEVCVRFRIFHLGFPEAEESAWTRGRALEATGPFERIPGPEDLLIKHAVDLIISDFSDLRLVLDVALLLERNREKLDWTYIETRLRRRGCFTGFYFVIKHIGDILQLQRPGSFLPPPGNLRGSMFRFAWSTTEPDYLAVGDAEHNLKFALLESRTLGDRAALLRAVLSPAYEWVSKFYGRPSNKRLKLIFILRSLCGKWMKARRPQDDYEETHTLKPGQRLLE